MKIADVRVMRADIPVRRPHKMSFTTLEVVNFVFVRLEAADGQVGWGEAACLGGPTWSEESAESVVAIVERYVTPWLRDSDATGIEAVSREMARRVQGNPFARAAVEMALWDLNARALGVPADVLTAMQAAALDPSVRMDIAGAVYFPKDCHLSPARFMAGLQQQTEAAGAKFSWETEVTGWRVKDRRIEGVQTSRGEFQFDEYVLCGGSWSPA